MKTNTRFDRISLSSS